MIELQPCVACGALVPERQDSPYVGHKQNCTLVAQWLTEERRGPPSPELAGRLHASDFAPSAPHTAVVINYEDGSSSRFKHAFFRREGQWIAVYTEYCGYHMIPAASVESVTGPSR